MTVIIIYYFWNALIAATVHPHLRFVAQLPGANQGEQLISQLVRYISDRSWLYNLGRLRMDFLMPEAILEVFLFNPSLPNLNRTIASRRAARELFAL
jgi:hypothetical protein